MDSGGGGVAWDDAGFGSGQADRQKPCGDSREAAGAECRRAAPPNRWTAAQEALLGKMPDEEIAGKLGRTAAAVIVRETRVFWHGRFSFSRRQKIDLESPWLADGHRTAVRKEKKKSH